LISEDPTEVFPTLRPTALRGFYKALPAPAEQTDFPTISWKEPGTPSPTESLTTTDFPTAGDESGPTSEEEGVFDLFFDFVNEWRKGGQE